MKSLFAGYVSGAIWKAFKNNELSDDLDWEDVLFNLCHFWIDRDVGSGNDLPPELGLLQNIICRGIPTLPSIFIENKLAQLSKLLKFEQRGEGENAVFVCELTPPDNMLPEIKQLIERAFCPVVQGAILEASAGFTLPGFGTGDENSTFDSEAEKDSGLVHCKGFLAQEECS